MSGNSNLFDSVIEATGLPQELIGPEFLEILDKSNLNPESLSMDELRFVLAEYLQETFKQKALLVKESLVKNDF